MTPDSETATCLHCGKVFDLYQAVEESCILTPDVLFMERQPFALENAFSAADDFCYSWCDRECFAGWIAEKAQP